MALDDPAPEPAGKRGRPPVLDERRIVVAALRLIDGAGFDGLTVRALSAELAVSPAAIYGHVESKDAVVDLVIDHLLAEIRVPSHGHARARVEGAAVSMMQTLQAHPGLSQAVLQRGAVGPHGVAVTEQVLALLRQAGTPDEALWDAYHVLLVYIHGHVLATTWPRTSRHRSRSTAARGRLLALPPESVATITAASRGWHDDPQARFLLGLRALLDGVCPSGRP
ncbi:TetR/AcrR family transcriptional regulator [Rugosimonospora africana]|uniref:AcrR family transcriptional regulator n=1 Tax=Rugosimonospora africana TaxID=556532 RepID=A0A8J3VQW5_9ACTN|nr:TetR/AcrR family transcriptional regulator [Rugosimonospora africana]GIH15534.1 AcrR family transcriptional regulator [Rugosimonospora africana]